MSGPSLWIWIRSLRGRCRDRVTINSICDDVVLEVFSFCVNCRFITTSRWHTLVHACQGWRCIVFAFPHRLNLRLVYTGKRAMAEMLDVWPVLPMVMNHTTVSFSRPYLDTCLGNMAAALESEHDHHICAIDLSLILTSRWERLAAAMQKPFPQLTYLRILEKEKYDHVPSGPVLWWIRPHFCDNSSWKIALVTALSSMSGLETLWVTFDIQ
ncbi:hypothetical protein F5148DRAFT_1372293 [Russula earlei]|uniref:Uncharacterized protein n=1 Tax=Russula earlei TaxID=71964 RepID=A0ACC0TQM7_9AGAM|nr:hypothetical protein F5148DRAFT_1372293 [Russula earlei]